MTSEIIHLNCDDFPSQITDNLKHLSGDPDFADVTLAFEDDTRISGNKIVLSAISPVLRNTLKKLPGPNPCVLLFGMNSNIVKSLLDFVFMGQIDIQKDCLDGFLQIANLLQIKGFSFADVRVKVPRAGDSTVKSESKIKVPEILVPTEIETCDFTLEESLVVDTQLETFNFENETVPGTNKDQQWQKWEKEMNNIYNKAPPEHEASNTFTVVNNDKPSDGRKGTLKKNIHEERQYDNEGFRCFHCKNMFKTLEILKEHEEIKHVTDKTKTYKCEECSESFFKLIYMKQHKRKVHGGAGVQNACDTCGRSFKSEKSLNTHIDYAHPVPGKLFKCKLCSKESLTKNASNVHYYQAHPEWERKAFFEGKK